MWSTLKNKLFLQKANSASEDISTEQKAVYVAEWIRSGQTGVQFAQSRGLNVSDLNSWESDVAQSGVDLDILIAGKALKPAHSKPATPKPNKRVPEVKTENARKLKANHSGDSSVIFLVNES